ncbi:MAG: DUF2384 domain-containing protein [Pseudomonadota bacterium]|nr:MAG: DUF2384 domain-containing protein [Pseudomonadota bacterium]
MSRDTEPSLENPILTYDEQVQVSRAVIALLDDWQVSANDQIRLLALPANTKPRQLRRYYENKPLPDEPEIWSRVEHLVGIADALRTSYPHSAQGGAIWMNRVNYRFGDRTPIVAMVEDGLAGILAVRMHLDCAYDWHVDANAPLR